MTDGALRVLIADDHPLFRQGLRVLVDSASDMTVVGEAASGAEAIAQAHESRPDVVLMDLNMPPPSGVEATRRIVAQFPQTRVLVLTMFEEDESVFAAMRAGARGYLLKGSGRDEGPARRTDRRRRRGHLRTRDRRTAHVVLRIGDRTRAAAVPGADRARARGAHAARQRRRQQRDRGAARVSLKTVPNHVSIVFTKLRVMTRAQAIVKARGRDGKRAGAALDRRATLRADHGDPQDADV